MKKCSLIVSSKSLTLEYGSSLVFNTCNLLFKSFSQSNVTDNLPPAFTLCSGLPRNDLRAGESKKKKIVLF